VGSLAEILPHGIHPDINSHGCRRILGPEDVVVKLFLPQRFTEFPSKFVGGLLFQDFCEGEHTAGGFKAENERV